MKPFFKVDTKFFEKVIFKVLDYFLEPPPPPPKKVIKKSKSDIKFKQNVAFQKSVSFPNGKKKNVKINIQKFTSIPSNYKGPIMFKINGQNRLNDVNRGLNRHQKKNLRPPTPYPKILDENDTSVDYRMSYDSSDSGCDCGYDYNSEYNTNLRTEGPYLIGSSKQYLDSVFNIDLDTDLDYREYDSDES